MGWLTLTDVRRYFDPYDYVALAHYNDKPDERRYPFVVASRNESMPTPSLRVRLRRQAGLATYPDDSDKMFFFSVMILQDTRMMREGERGRVGLLLLTGVTLLLLLLCLRK
jgi:hypothetical protein